MRGARILPNPFPLTDFMGVRAEDAQKLSAVGIRYAGQMLEAGRTKAQRETLALQTGIAEETILELVKLSDLARIPGVKGVRARLYLECGLDSPARLAQLDPQELVRRVTEYVQRSGFPGVPTLPEEARHTVESTAKLPDVVEY